MKLKAHKIFTANNWAYLGAYVDEDLLFEYLDQMKRILGANKFYHYHENLSARNLARYHITLISPHEYNLNYKRTNCNVDFEADVYFIGLGRVKKYSEDVFFVVCESDDFDKFRSDQKLPKRDFHVTLGFKHRDIHNVPKGSSSLVRRKG